MIEFRETLEPRPFEIGEVTVECHLYDEQARQRAAAEARAAGDVREPV